MGVDLQKIKERAAEEEAKALARAAGGARFWTPKAGENKVRLLPPWTSDPQNPNRDSFFREIYVHFSVGLDEDSAKVFSCPAKTPHVQKTACAVCMFVEKLRHSGVPSDAELADNMRAKQRFYTNVIVLDDPVYTDKDLAEWKARENDKTRECPWAVGDSKVQVMTYGPQIWNDLMAIFMDSQVDVTDLEKGHNVIIKKEGEKLRTKYRASAEWQPQSMKLVGRALAEVTVNLDALMPFQLDGVMQEALAGIGTIGMLPGAPAGGMQQQRPAPGLPAAGGGTNGASQPKPQQLQQPKPQPQAAQPQPTPAAQPAATPKSLPQAAPSADDLPPCYLDKATVDPQDAECVGGKKGEDVYDPCPGFGPCHAAKFGTEPEKEKPKTRRSAAKRTPAVDTSQPGSVEALEKEMKDSLNK